VKSRAIRFGAIGRLCRLSLVHSTRRRRDRPNAMPTHQSSGRRCWSANIAVSYRVGRHAAVRFCRARQPSSAAPILRPSSLVTDMMEPRLGTNSLTDPHLPSVNDGLMRPRTRSNPDVQSFAEQVSCLFGRPHPGMRPSVDVVADHRRQLNVISLLVDWDQWRRCADLPDITKCAGPCNRIASKIGCGEQGAAVCWSCQGLVVHPPNRRLCTILNLDLAEDRFNVDFNCRFGDFKFPSYGFIGVAVDQTAQD
jgi:hypothetical protein